MTTRAPLPNRRPSLTQDCDWQGLRISVTMGLDPETGQVREVFADTPHGGQMQATLADACVLVSIALQHGIPARALAKSLAVEPDPLRGPDATQPASPIGVLLDAILAWAPWGAAPDAPDPAPVSPDTPKGGPVHDAG